MRNCYAPAIRKIMDLDETPKEKTKYLTLEDYRLMKDQVAIWERCHPTECQGVPSSDTKNL